ncbi:MAG: Asp-tRNA(Asn)/Glu-tRNA(Gln) amidotransferase subunit GatB [Candidatus Pacebacteria bacterium]|nr:Asp-tRNA(Asn)/Glu-tRNA(Gln) amidotransferase subunit GatB [Candidatus Paceibacterota bacterium]MBP9852091.1 Asp-tRNA(Asn)/Glu-tRNA(Gln) amidotransferase subunit GatB [Candidatus Paceibacterota bacterium]
MSDPAAKGATKNYYVTIGLEVHAELKTKTKMFCSCKNDPDETRPNVNICPVCMAHPGALPVANKEAVRQVIRVGLAVDGTIADFSEFDRKNYFYPDIPKGYQISQYKYPIVSGGKLGDFSLTRIHLEEDTGTSKHDRGDFSLVDFNRAGVPLMELVTDAHTFAAGEAKDASGKMTQMSAAEMAGAAAAKFAREYQLVLWYLGASEANMEKGEMRVEANISVTTDPAALTDSPEINPKAYGTKVEVKNLNSVRSAERAIKFEAARMIELIEAGKGNEITQETRGWDEVKQSTFSQRSKEEAQDYRYFPDPDLPKMKLHELFDLAVLKNELPELPVVKRARYRADFGIKDEDIESYVGDPILGRLFEDGVREVSDNKELVKMYSNYITNDYISFRKENPEAKIPDHMMFIKLIGMLHEGKLSSRAAKDILPVMINEGKDPEVIADEGGLLQKNDEGALKEIAAKVIAENPAVVEIYKGGKENALMSLVGIIMKETKGSANPQLVQKILKELL